LHALNAMSNFSLYLTANPFNGQGHLTALKFAQAAVESGHRIAQVFFSSDAVLVGHRSNDPASDEPNPQALWQQLATTQACELLLCSSACQKRGLSGDGTFPNIADKFVIAGLGSLIETALKTDRLIQFPG